MYLQFVSTLLANSENNGNERKAKRAACVTLGSLSSSTGSVTESRDGRLPCLVPLLPMLLVELAVHQQVVVSCQHNLHRTTKVSEFVFSFFFCACKVTLCLWGSVPSHWLKFTTSC